MCPSLSSHFQVRAVDEDPGSAEASADGDSAPKQFSGTDVAPHLRHARDVR